MHDFPRNDRTPVICFIESVERRGRNEPRRIFRLPVRGFFPWKAEGRRAPARSLMRLSARTVAEERENYGGDTRGEVHGSRRAYYDFYWSLRSRSRTRYQTHT